jgi:hypothetical protein
MINEIYVRDEIIENTDDSILSALDQEKYQEIDTDVITPNKQEINRLKSEVINGQNPEDETNPEDTEKIRLFFVEIGKAIESVDLQEEYDKYKAFMDK